MNDEFLNQFRQQPSERFAKDLYARISQPGKDTTKSVKQHSFAFRLLAIGSIALVLVFAALLAASPSARAFVADILREIGGISFTETSQYPGGDGPVTIVPTQLMTLEEAQAMVPYPIQLPAWVPEGSVRLDPVEVTEFSNCTMISIRWEIVANGAAPRGLPTFWLTILPHSCGGQIVGPDAIEEVNVNNQPAALIKGGWDYDARTWNPDISFFQLTWKKGEQYNLSWPSQLPLEDLIRVAESIP